MKDNKIQTEKRHQRRVRYKGTHPRTFAEKYKEHNPEKYKETIEKVIRKGSTPAGMHISIMVDEILDFLQIKPGQKGLDATLGYGGHTVKMLEQLRGEGHIYGLDIDPIEIKKTEKRLAEKGYGNDIFTAVNINFKDIDKVAEKYGPFDFVLADLGVSSMQIDDPRRGFTYKHEGPLDLRLNPKQGISASERIQNITQDELEGMFIENSDEPYAYEIAKMIMKERRKKKIETTLELKNIVEKAVLQSKDVKNMSNRDKDETVKKSCARVFQALRIDVNNEFEVLYEFLEKLMIEYKKELNNYKTIKKSLNIRKNNIKNIFSNSRSVLKLINKGIGITLFMDFIEQNSLFEEKILVRATFKEYIQSAKSMIELVNTVK